VKYVNGAPTVFTTARTGNFAAVTVLPEADHHVVLIVGTANHTAKPANFGTENITAQANGKTLRVYTYDGLARKIKSDSMWRGIAAGAGAGFRAGAAVQPARTTYGGNIYNPYGQPYSYRGWATTSDPAQ